MFKSLLSHPSLYLLFQKVIGGIRSRRLSIQQYLDIAKGDRILDIGCGPGFVATFVAGSTYIGYDVERSYIEYARRRYASLGNFYLGEFTEAESAKYKPFDFVMMNGLLHHLDDAASLDLLRLSRNSLKPGGQVLCIDGGTYHNQNKFARYLLDHDRGQFVRPLPAYKELAVQVFGADNVKADLREDLLYIPYSLVILVLQR